MNATTSQGEAGPEEVRKVRLARLRHDLKTPVNHIIGYSEILLEDLEDVSEESLKRDLHKIRSGGYQLLALINQYFGEKHAQAGSIKVDQLRHELRTPIHYIIGYAELLEEECEERNLPNALPDLQRIISAAKAWLETVENHLPTLELSREGGSHSPVKSDEFSFREWNQIVDQLPALDVFRSEQGQLLVVDDDEANRELLQRRLEKLGYQVSTCVDGESALTLAKQEPVELLLLDLVMPQRSGYEILVEIKSEPDLKHLPVLMISALDQMEGITHCIEAGAEDFISKPFDPVFLRARIGAALEKKRMRDWEQVYTRQLEEEKKKFERLLRSILPDSVAGRLNRGEGAIVDSFSEVTVLFADLVGFTGMSLHLQPTILVELLNEIFSMFDELAERHGLEKIKTIGDAYMAVAGLPAPRTDHAVAAASMAVDMQNALSRFNHEKRTGLKMRVGMDSGPVIAGIIGRSKFAYDLWGNTVNTASRMESHSQPGCIQVTAATARLLQNHFRLEKQKPLSIRGKGRLETYFLLPPSAP